MPLPPPFLTTKEGCLSENRHAGQEASPPFHSAVLVRPGEHGVVVGARVIRAPARAGLGLALEVRVGGAHDGLSEIIEAVSRVVRDLFR